MSRYAASSKRLGREPRWHGGALITRSAVASVAICGWTERRSIAVCARRAETKQPRNGDAQPAPVSWRRPETAARSSATDIASMLLSCPRSDAEDDASASPRLSELPAVGSASPGGGFREREPVRQHEGAKRDDNGKGRAGVTTTQKKVGVGMGGVSNLRPPIAQSERTSVSRTTRPLPECGSGARAKSSQ
jgi:hypothetical protein